MSPDAMQARKRLAVLWPSSRKGLYIDLYSINILYVNDPLNTSFEITFLLCECPVEGTWVKESLPCITYELGIFYYS